MSLLGYTDPKPGPGVTEPSPKEGWPRYRFIVSNHFWSLIALNLLFLVSSVPLITIPASLAGMTSVLMCLVRDGNASMREDFIREFKADFPRRMFVWFALQLIPLGIWLLLKAFIGRDAASGVSAVFAALLYVVESYWFPMIVTLDISVWDAFRDALLLVPLEKKGSLVLLAVGFLFGLFSTGLYPYSLFVLLFGGFSFVQLAACVVANGAIERRILKKDAGSGDPPPAQ